MTSAEQELLTAIELHSVEGIRAALDGGLDPRSQVAGRSLTTWLTEMYTRSDMFPDCLRLLLERGAELADPMLAPVLLDDEPAIRRALDASPSLIAHRTTMVSAFTPLVGASLLHVAAEYGHATAVRVLLERGAEVDCRAALDANGFNGHTALFHTVNSNDNRSAPILHQLLAAGASPATSVRGITWGKGFDWETTVYDVTPVSYAQLGLLPQMHRQEEHIYANIALLLQASGRPAPTLSNVPNRYLKPKDTA